MSGIKAWIEAMRLRTLPVSVAGVVTGGGCAAYYGCFRPLPFLICLLFAVGAQIVSNFANEYFDYRNGLDRRGREGFRRGVTEGDITPRAMLRATLGLLLAVCALGCTLMVWGGWWLLFVGVAVALFALAYSAGPYPLSHHGLGEVAVILFFGFVPVIFTVYVQVHGVAPEAPFCTGMTFLLALAVGLMGANVLVVNNYRDRDDDRAVGKRTLAVRWGGRAMRRLYLFNGFAALLCIETAVGLRIPLLWNLGGLAYANVLYLTWMQMCAGTGRELNPVLGRTALAMFGVSVWLLLALALNPQSLAGCR